MVWAEILMILWIQAANDGHDLDETTTMPRRKRGGARERVFRGEPLYDCGQLDIKRRCKYDCSWPRTKFKDYK